jgi:hypothetical protein
MEQVDVREQVFLHLPLPSLLESCSIDSISANICANESFWIEYNRIHYYIEPEDYLFQVQVIYDPKLKLVVTDKKHDAKEMAKISHSLIHSSYDNYSIYLSVRSLKEFYANGYLEYIITRYMQDTNQISADSDNWIFVVQLIRYGTIINLSSILNTYIVRNTINSGFSELTHTKTIYYTFHQFRYSDFLSTEECDNITVNPIALFDTTFGYSFIKYILTIAMEPTQYFDPRTDSILIVNYNSNIKHIEFFDADPDLGAASVQTIDLVWRIYLRDTLVYYSNKLSNPAYEINGSDHDEIVKEMYVKLLDIAADRQPNPLDEFFQDISVDVEYNI